MMIHYFCVEEAGVDSKHGYMTYRPVDKTFCGRTIDRHENVKLPNDTPRCKICDRKSGPPGFPQCSMSAHRPVYAGKKQE